jgi:4-amino-4-deoxy-L-arabinose transferase-like glycosyltransferase
MRRLRYGRGFGHVFGLLFLARHPVFLVVLLVVGLVVWLYQKRR